MSGAVGSSKPRPAKPVRLSSREKNAARRARRRRERPHYFGIRPRGGARRAHLPHRNRVVDVAARGIHQHHETRGELNLDLRLDSLEEIVDLVEVVVPRASFGGRAFGGSIAGDDALVEGRG